MTAENYVPIKPIETEKDFSKVIGFAGGWIYKNEEPQPCDCDIGKFRKKTQE